MGKDSREPLQGATGWKSWDQNSETECGGVPPGICEPPPFSQSTDTQGAVCDLFLPRVMP